jgi:hypothetical protein
MTPPLGQYNEPLSNPFVGGGARERVFWNNYFFHCAYTRYEAGLSIDEIWSYQQESSTSEGAGVGAASATTDIGGTDEKVAAAAAAGGLTEEETVDFDGNATPSGSTTDPAFQEMGDDAKESAQVDAAIADSALGSGNDFELVDDGDAADGGTGDPEMDELEEEIARELEGL